MKVNTTLKPDTPSDPVPVFTRKIHPDLPVFELQSDNRNVLYAPGQIAVVDPLDAAEIRRGWTRDAVTPLGSIARQTGQWLEVHAIAAREKLRAFFDSPFLPECLTLYLSNQCNLDCLYCYSQGHGICGKTEIEPALPVIEDSVVISAAMIVAKNCADKGLPFHLVLHGGGEPTRLFERVQKYTILTRQIAGQFALDWFGYIATNGVMPEENARWLAKNFTRIGLSCDGPPDIQDRQRPMKNGDRTSSLVQRTAKVLSEHGADISIRATVTPWSFMRQSEIVSYFYDDLGASTIRLEPAYRLWERKQPEFTAEQVPDFVANFMDARKTAEKMGCSISLSGIRLEEVHGPFCDVFRNVLRLTPNGSATTCFLISDESLPASSLFSIGRTDSDSGDFILNTKQIDALRRSFDIIPAKCSECINICHCARGCPDRCLVSSGSSIDEPKKRKDNDFSCLLYQKLSQALIMDAADRLVNTDHRRVVTTLPNVTMPDGETDACMSDLPVSVDTGEIRKQLKAVSGTYDIASGHMPEPAWRERGFTFNGLEAWNGLRRLFSEMDGRQPMSLYLHVPFCERRCPFCDCNAIPFGKNRSGKEDAFCQALLAEMHLWSGIDVVNRRPVTTVHFGGGTPGCLSSPVFEQILMECRNLFHVHDQTEWALESTVSHIRQDDLSRLGERGFSRLHVGLQTLDDDLRKSIGRKTSAKDATFRIKKAIQAGFVISVDVLYGLPGQRITDVLDTLSVLIDLEIHGLSLYRFNISKRNRWYVKRCRGFNPDPQREYIMFQAADQMLVKAGYRKNHFVHYATEADRNLYFTCPQRGEDLLAMGPTADGFFSNYRYRNSQYTGYMNQLRNNPERPALEGGLQESDLETRARPAIHGIMGSHIRRSVHENLGIENLLRKWEDCLLIHKLSGEEDFRLTPNGSWFVNHMITDVLHDFKTGKND